MAHCSCSVASLDANMDPSPLLRAHDHARAASVATRQASDTTVAINEHTQAAGEFAAAATPNSSAEVLRMLKLFEDHHRKLADLLNLPPPQLAHHQSTGGNIEGDDDSSGTVATDEKTQTQQEIVISGGAAADVVHGRKQPLPEPAKTAQKPGAPQQRRLPSREMSSSIASNLASARGIRSKYQGQPLTPSVSNQMAPGNVDTHPRRTGSKAKMQNIIEHQPGKPTWVPPTASSSRSSKEGSRGGNLTSPSSHMPTDSLANPAEDPAYSRFYNTFGSLINRISAPLAFAGLPLIQEEPTSSDDTAPAETSQARKQSHPPKVHGHADPDLSKIYSKAAMGAIANDGYGASESFYVVPTSGHTISYANILSYAEKEKRRLGASAYGTIKEGPGDDDDDFVDAREVPASLSPGAQRRIGRGRTERELGNTIEELYTENKSLKDMLDKLTKRLHTFEASAQKMSESYRLMRPGSPPPALPTLGGSGGGGGGTSSKSHETDEEFSDMKKHIERLERENRKMQKTLEKYREKWETLKAGAKARREAQVSGESVEDARTG